MNRPERSAVEREGRGEVGGSVPGLDRGLGRSPGGRHAYAQVVDLRHTYRGPTIVGTLTGLASSIFGTLTGAPSLDGTLMSYGGPSEPRSGRRHAGGAACR